MAYSTKAGGDSIEFGDFFLAFDGLSGGGAHAVLSTPSGINPVMTFTTVKPLKLLNIRSGSVGFTDSESLGISAGAFGSGKPNFCTCSLPNYHTTNDGFCLSTFNTLLNGWNGRVTAIGPTSFDITFSRLGLAGIAIQGQYTVTTGV